jgi:glycine cleavage system H protein
MHFPPMRFTRDHEWIALDGDIATVGITAFAAEQLGDVVFVELPEVGRVLAAGEGFAVVESVKAASDIYAPVSGRVTAVNTDLAAAPETVNAEPQGGGWFARLTLSDPGELDGLMDQAAYDAFVGGR